MGKAETEYPQGLRKKRTKGREGEEVLQPVFVLSFQSV